MNPVEIAAEVLQCDPATLRAERIKGGLTNESWCVTSDREAVVVRISTADEQALQLNRTSERQVLQLVEAAHIGAPVLLCAPERRLLVTRFVPGHALSREYVRTPRMVERLAQVLKRLHEISAGPEASALSSLPGERQSEGSSPQWTGPLPGPLSQDGRGAAMLGSGIQEIHLTTVLHGYWGTLEAHEGAIAPSDRHCALDIAAESAQERELRLCHNDVHHLNVIDTGDRLCLLDWEYAGLGDPYFDLASVCCYHAYDAALRAHLLASYCGAGRGDLERLQRMCWLFDYIKELWLKVRESSGTTPS